ncbi:hypothetical protein JWG44_21825 [Leptospira sp. 201903071]|uniref:LIC10906 family membrane protein n=1 Tax=Leptospira ainazelensis TaxID=2810034 RepID=UPI001966C08C|nr:histidine kinase N-terminal 7TM domain-containing protein [Leptospira ainazelensis]MBM9502895.1 hypothetical protein [Leptospira ainazelensis]
MDVVFWVSLFCSLAVLFLGVYVFRVGERVSFETRKTFLTLTATLSIWVFGSGVREYIPESLSRLAPNWILAAVVFVPFYLKELTLSILEEKYEPSREFRTFEYFLLGYLVLSCFFSATINVMEEGISVYKPLFAYHVLIAYSVLYVSASIFLMLRKAIRYRGIVRVRSTLLMLGTLSGFIVSILFVYILPIFGIYKGYFSVFGILSWVFFWSVAIIQYNAFEIRELILRNPFTAKREIPFLSRISLKPVLGLYFLLDPLGYRLRLRKSRIEIVRYLLQYQTALMNNSEMNQDTQLRKVTKIFERFLK